MTSQARLGTSAGSASIETLILLEQWGLWARKNTGVYLGLPTKSSTVIDPASAKSPFISDEFALYIDQCVSQIENERARVALALHYVRTLPKRKIRAILKCRYDAVRVLLAIGESEVEEMLTR